MINYMAKKRKKDQKRAKNEYVFVYLLNNIYFFNFLIKISNKNILLLREFSKFFYIINIIKI